MPKGDREAGIVSLLLALLFLGAITLVSSRDHEVVAEAQAQGGRDTDRVRFWPLAVFGLVGTLLIAGPTFLILPLFRDTTIDFDGSVRVMSIFNQAAGPSLVGRTPPRITVVVAGDGSDSPFAEIRVAAPCGFGAAAGVVLLEGDARLANGRVSVLGEGFDASLVETTHADPVLGRQPVQIARFEIPALECPESVAPGQFSQAHLISGYFGSAVVERNGSRSSAAGPSFSEADFSDLETVERQFPDLLVGVFGPVEFDYSMDVFLSSTEEIVGSPGGMFSTTPLAWSSQSALRPSVEWVDVDVDEERDLWVILFGIAVGIGASMLASAAFAIVQNRAE